MTLEQITTTRPSMREPLAVKQEEKENRRNSKAQKKRRRGLATTKFAKSMALAIADGHGFFVNHDLE